MRDVIKIFLPKELTIEEDISRQIVQSEREFKAGKGKKLRSLRDLR